MSNLLTVKEAADLLGVSTKTIRRWEADGKIKSIRTTGNHRRFDVSELLGNKSDSSLTVAYARVSSHDTGDTSFGGDLQRRALQKEDLKRQVLVLESCRSHKNKQIVQQLKEVADQLK